MRRFLDVRLSVVGRLRAKAFFAGLCLLACVPIAHADAVSDFYRGKTINLYVGYSAGGTYDLYARAVARFIGSYIPGKPNIVVRTMAGAGSRLAAGYVAQVAQRDGTSLATADQSLAIEQAMGDKTLKVDVTALNFIGNPIVVNNIVVTWYASGVKTIEDAKRKEVTLGATGGSTSSQYPEAMNALLGTKFKVILGYPGGADINVAMENGEVGGRGSNDWVSWKATKPNWLREHKLNLLVQIGLQKERDLPDVPLLMDLATNHQDRAVLRVLSSPTSIGRPIFAGPGVPRDRVEALRSAFDATMKDPAFIAETRSEKLDLNPVSGSALNRLVNEIVNAPALIRQRLKDILNSNDGGL